MLGGLTSLWHHNDVLYLFCVIAQIVARMPTLARGGACIQYTARAKYNTRFTYSNACIMCTFLILNKRPTPPLYVSHPRIVVCVAINVRQLAKVIAGEEVLGSGEDRVSEGGVEDDMQYTQAITGYDFSICDPTARPASQPRLGLHSTRS